MKKPILLLLTIISCNLFSQQKVKNFKIIQNQLVWQEVYETDKTKEEILQFISRKTHNKDQNGYFEDININFKRLGYSDMVVLLYLQGKMKANYRVDFKENMYRVSVYNIETFTPIEIDFGGVTGKASYKEIEYFALKNKNTTFKNSFKKKPSTILEYNFDIIFQYQEQELDFGNW